MTADALERLLRGIDGRGYGAYKRLRGVYELPGWSLHVDSVQSDPFASPSRVRLRVSHELAGVPMELRETKVRRVAIADFLARAVDDALPSRSREGSGRSGEIRIDAGGAEILERTAVVLDAQAVEARLEVGLPAAGRRVLGAAALRLLRDELSAVVARALTWANVDVARARAHVESAERHEEIGRLLEERDLLAFVADGAVLPRRSGASQEPLAGAVPFRSPPGLRETLSLADGAEITGMALPTGVSLVVGGGYHGKSTLLQALERSIHPHAPGDGRELVVTRRDAVKVRAEEGRSITGLDVRAFLDDLPDASDTSCFSTANASGSTSQAAGLLEALEVGARALLVDEDTSANNFLGRDARMESLVTGGEEPIIPFADRVRDLYERFGVSTILVAGGSGTFFDAADTVIKMSSYVPEDVTAEAKDIARRLPHGRREGTLPPMEKPPPRRLVTGSVDPSRGRRDVRVEARGPHDVRFGRESLDLRGVEQMVDGSQARAAALGVALAARSSAETERDLDGMMKRLEARIDEEGLDVLSPRPGGRPGNLARPRRFEVAAVLNRLRSVEMEPSQTS